jgi:hypothetical protein
MRYSCFKGLDPFYLRFSSVPPHMSYWVESDETRIIIIVVGKFYQHKILDLASFKIQNTQSQHVFQGLNNLFHLPIDLRMKWCIES